MQTIDRKTRRTNPTSTQNCKRSIHFSLFLIFICFFFFNFFQANLTSQQLHSVETIGGGTRLSTVLSRLQESIGVTLSQTLNREEAITRACAIQVNSKSIVFNLLFIILLFIIILLLLFLGCNVVSSIQGS